MQESKFNFAFVFSIIVLLVFSYITFLGLVYWKEGDFVMPCLLTAILIASVLICVYVMCLAKATRWKRIGTIGQLFFGLIILVVLLSAAFPFTNFLRVTKDSKEISKRVTEVCDAAISLDKAYETYVNKRIEDYQSNLSIIVKGKKANPTRYKECVGGASGKTDEEKISNLSKSLKNKLYPESTKAIVEERHDWLEGARNASVWNPFTPSNIQEIDNQVKGWVDNYKNLASKKYKGEDSVEFNYESFSSKLSQLTNTYTVFQRPSFFSVIISVICFLVMLLPYIVTRKSLAGATSKSKNNQTLYE